jgi:hypothetical protein
VRELVILLVQGRLMLVLVPMFLAQELTAPTQILALVLPLGPLISLLLRVPLLSLPVLLFLLR